MNKKYSTLPFFLPAIIIILCLSGLFTSNRWFLNFIIITMATVSAWLLKNWISTITESYNDIQSQTKRLESANETIKKISLELNKSSERYNMIQKSANIGSWNWDMTTGDLSWSGQIEPMFGFAKGEFGATYEAFMKSVHPDDRDYVQSSVVAAIEGNKIYDIEHRIVWPDGSLKWVSEKGTVYRDGQNKPVRMTGIVQEITRGKIAELEKKKSYEELELIVRERTADLKDTNRALWDKIEKLKRVELELIRSGQTLQGIFDGISDPLLLIGKNLEIIKYNVSAKNRFNIDSAEDGLNMKCYERLFGHIAVCENCPIKEIVSQKRIQIFERKYEGEGDRIEQVYLYPVIKKRGGHEHTVVRIQDITQRKFLERKLLQNEKLVSIGILVSGIAHEINNPNNFITFNLPILKDYLNEIIPIIDAYAEDKPELEFFYMPYREFRDDLFKLLENVEHGSKRITSIVNDLKEFTRTDHEKKRQQVNIKKVINKVATFTRSKIKRSVKTFTINISKNIPFVFLDPQAIEQVLVNILINAAQAFDNINRKDSKITFDISYDIDIDRLIFNIRDNGCGMDQESLNKLFDPFYTTKNPDQGTGLGLYICHNLVTGMNGKIEVESEIGQGTLFSVILKNITASKNSEA